MNRRDFTGAIAALPLAVGFQDEKPSREKVLSLLMEMADTASRYGYKDITAMLSLVLAADERDILESATFAVLDKIQEWNGRNPGRPLPKKLGRS